MRGVRGGASTPPSRTNRPSRTALCFRPASRAARSRSTAVGRMTRAAWSATAIPQTRSSHTYQVPPVTRTASTKQSDPSTTKVTTWRSSRRSARWRCSPRTISSARSLVSSTTASSSSRVVTPMSRAVSSSSSWEMRPPSPFCRSRTRVMIDAASALVYSRCLASVMACAVHGALRMESAASPRRCPRASSAFMTASPEHNGRRPPRLRPRPASTAARWSPRRGPRWAEAGLSSERPQGPWRSSRIPPSARYARAMALASVARPRGDWGWTDSRRPGRRCSAMASASQTLGGTTPWPPREAVDGGGEQRRRRARGRASPGAARPRAQAPAPCGSWSPRRRWAPRSPAPRARRVPPLRTRG